VLIKKTLRRHGLFTGFSHLGYILRWIRTTNKVSRVDNTNPRLVLLREAVTKLDVG